MGHGSSFPGRVSMCPALSNGCPASHVVEVEVTEAIKVRRGITGPLKDWEGGAEQVQFLGGKAAAQSKLKAVGDPSQIPGSDPLE